MEREKIGVLLTAGFSPSYPRDNSSPRYPNLEGRFRCLNAKYALEQGKVQEIIVVGGMRDCAGQPVEKGYFNYLKILLKNNPLSDKVSVLPRSTETTETIGDIAEVSRMLRERHDDTDLVFISHNWHLFPRLPLILQLERCRGQFLSVEEIFQKNLEGQKDTKRIINNVLSPADRLKYHIRENLLSMLLILDFLPFSSRIGTKLIQAEARRERI